MGGAATSSGGAAGAGGGAPCNPPCGGGLVCCDGVCSNPGNDIKNCGMCGMECQGPFPFCDGGTCGKAPCDPNSNCTSAPSCCGSQCCDTGKICCVVPMGPVGPPECVDPNENGTCEPGCPDCVCASPETPIATPYGDRAIADLAVGDLVYSVDGGVVKIVPLAKVNRVEVQHHRVMRVALASGVVLHISPRHPTAGGKTFGDLRPGDDLHGNRVVAVESEAYGHSHTYDILPASDSGAYFAGGALIGSTLAESPARVPEGCFSVER
jgi:hypothetical protein